MSTPPVEGIEVDLKQLRGKVVLIDFWAYSCINCQRSIPHVVGWYNAYHDKGFDVIGVHTPEYAFEHNRSNVATATAELRITYPVRDGQRLCDLDQLPQPVLAGPLPHRCQRHSSSYQVRRRRLRRHRTPYAAAARGAASIVGLPPAVDTLLSTTPTSTLTPETYLGAQKAANYRGQGAYDQGTATFDYPAQLPNDSFALGPRPMDPGPTKRSSEEDDDATIALNYRPQRYTWSS